VFGENKVYKNQINGLGTGATVKTRKKFYGALPL
jgi:hypothetical protein